MILLRGIKGESYARQIKKGIVGCRDILSAILSPPKTGYEFSDYYEKNFVKAIEFFTKEKDIHDPNVMYSVLTDYYLPYIYLSYFHVLNKSSLEWLNHFDEDYSFIAIDVVLDKITNTLIGEGFFGKKMSYVQSIRDLNQNEAKELNVACMCSLENDFIDKLEMSIPVNIYNTLAFALFCRETSEKFTDIENEFRIISYDCPRMKKCILNQKSRELIVNCQSGLEYEGVVKPGEEFILDSKNKVIIKESKNLYQILMEEKGKITIDSRFKSLNIKSVTDRRWFLGGKKECSKFIEDMLERGIKTRYINRTVQREYNIDEVDAIFLPGHMDVDY